MPTDQLYYGSPQQADDLQHTAANLANHLAAKERDYKGSWQKRGGISAYMMLARKWDRIEPTAKEYGYDAFRLWDRLEEIKEGEMNDLEDLAGYLLLIINEMRINRNGLYQAGRRLVQERNEAFLDALNGPLEEFTPLPPGSNPDHYKDHPTEEEIVELTAREIATKLHCPGCKSEELITIHEEIQRQRTLTTDLKPVEMLKCSACGNTFYPPTEIDGVTHQPPAHGTWEESHPFNYESAGNQCAHCGSTFIHIYDQTVHCRTCKKSTPVIGLLQQWASESNLTVPQVRNLIKTGHEFKGHKWWRTTLTSLTTEEALARAENITYQQAVGASPSTKPRDQSSIGGRHKPFPGAERK